MVKSYIFYNYTIFFCALEELAPPAERVSSGLLGDLSAGVPPLLDGQQTPQLFQL